MTFPVIQGNMPVTLLQVWEMNRETANQVARVLDLKTKKCHFRNFNFECKLLFPNWIEAVAGNGSGPVLGIVRRHANDFNVHAWVNHRIGNAPSGFGELLSGDDFDVEMHG